MGDGFVEVLNVRSDNIFGEIVVEQGLDLTDYCVSVGLLDFI